VIRLQHEDMAGLDTLLREKYGFDADIDHFAIFGYCRVCIAAGRGRRDDEPAVAPEQQR
jgi:hypothetical protein